MIKIQAICLVAVVPISTWAMEDFENIRQCGISIEECSFRKYEDGYDQLLMDQVFVDKLSASIKIYMRALRDPYESKERKEDARKCIERDIQKMVSAQKKIIDTLKKHSAEAQKKIDDMANAHEAYNSALHKALVGMGIDLKRASALVGRDEK